MLEGKKLRHGQNQWSAETRSFTEAQANAQSLSKKLEALLEGKPAKESISIADAVAKWLKFREQEGKGNTKADLMGRKLIDWCDKHGIVMMTAITTERAINFRMSLPFKTGDSSSLSVHWSVMNQFFNWAEGLGYIERNPCPNPKLMPQFRIKFDQKEVKPPTPKQVEKVILMAEGRVKLLMMLMRETGMALVDAQKFGMSTEDAKLYGLSKPERHPVIEGTVIRGNRTKTNERYRVRITQPLAEALKALGSPAFPGTYREWRERCYVVFKKAMVKMTPHGFRHFRISEWLAQGISAPDVSKMVGTSEKEIRKTYEHWIEEAEQRLDEVQRQSWQKMGLDANGNAREMTQ
jgi:integrase